MKLLKMIKKLKLKDFGVMEIIGEVICLIGTVISLIACGKRENLQEVC